MKKPFLLVSVISTAVVVCLFATSVVYAAPVINVENGVYNEDGELDDADSAPGPAFYTDETTTTVVYEYQYSIEIPEGDATDYNYAITDTVVGSIESGTLSPGGTVTGAAQAMASVADGDNTHTLTITLTPIGGTSVNYTDEVHYYGLALMEAMEIDIKPGSDVNPINLKSKGVVPVALIDFDPELLDGLTITIGEVEALRWAVEDVDGDGDDDVICHFKTQDLVEAGELGESTDALVVMIGATLNPDVNQYEGGYAGDDSVNIVPPDHAKAKGHDKGSASSSSNKGNKGNNGNKGGNGKNKNK